MKRCHRTPSVIGGAFVLSLAVCTPAMLTAAEPMKGDAQMMERCTKMQEQRQHMAEDLKAQDTELSARVVQLNVAAADKKTEELIVIVTRLVEQRTANHVRQAQMEQEMMQHMMQHMQMGKSSMESCPMMKSTMDMKGMEPPAIAK